MRRPEFIARQSRRPSGWLGRIIGRIMAHETADANRVALDLLELERSDRLLDVGCGHGAALASAAEIVTDGFLAGLDHSEIMLQIARRTNAALLESRRLELTLGDSLRIPFADGRFNKICSVHTVYFWIKPEPQLREILRVLSPGGRLVLAYHPVDDARFSREFPRSVYTFHSVADIETIMNASGFQTTRTEMKRGAGGLMAWTIGEKGGVRSGVAE